MGFVVSSQQFVSSTACCVVPPTGCSSSRTALALVFLRGVQSFRNRLLHNGSPTGLSSWQKVCSCMGSVPQACSSVGFPWAAVSFRPFPPAVTWDPPWAVFLRRYLLSMVLYGLLWDNLLHHGLPHRIQGNLRSGIWNISSSFADLGVCRAVFFTVLSSHTAVVQWISAYHKYIITGLLLALLMGSALSSSRSILAMSSMRALPGVFSQKSHLQLFTTSLATKIFPHKHNTTTLIYILIFD